MSGTQGGSSRPKGLRAARCSGTMRSPLGERTSFFASPPDIFPRAPPPPRDGHGRRPMAARAARRARHPANGKQRFAGPAHPRGDCQPIPCPLACYSRLLRAPQPGSEGRGHHSRVPEFQEAPPRAAAPRPRGAALQRGGSAESPRPLPQRPPEPRTQLGPSAPGRPSGSGRSGALPLAVPPGQSPRGALIGRRGQAAR